VKLGERAPQDRGKVLKFMPLSRLVLANEFDDQQQCGGMKAPEVAPASMNSSIHHQEGQYEKIVVAKPSRQRLSSLDLGTVNLVSHFDAQHGSGRLGLLKYTTILTLVPCPDQ